MITRFDFVLLLCLHGCIPSNSIARGPPNCNPCTLDQCEQCNLSKPPTTQCPDTTCTCPTQNPPTSVCSCPATEAIDCSQCLSTTIKAITTTTPQITTTAAITTTPTTSSTYPDPAEQKHGLCSDDQGPSPGAVIGVAIGGAIFGSILTTFVFVYIYRRSKNPFNSRDDQTSRTVRNAAYGYSNDNDQVNSVPVNSAYSEINDGMRKSTVISPILRQADSSKSDEVYNHLGESNKEDRSDYYDHAGPASILSIVEDGYGVLSMKGEGNDNYNTVDTNFCGKSMTDENKQSNDYFILDTQND